MKAFYIAWCMLVLAFIAFWGGLAYVVFHFISKLW